MGLAALLAAAALMLAAVGASRSYADSQMSRWRRRAHTIYPVRIFGFTVLSVPYEIAPEYIVGSAYLETFGALILILLVSSWYFKDYEIIVKPPRR